jgi:hypothetical protein
MQPLTNPVRDAVCLFLHIPKTAGTTLKSCVYEHFAVPGSDRDWFHDGIYYFPYGFHKPERPAFDAHARTAFARDDLRAVVGHFWYGAHALVPRPSYYVTLLRDPIERVTSLYYHDVATHHETFHDAIAARGASLEEFVTDFCCREVDNDQTRRIAGVEPGYRLCTTDLLELAKRNLRDRFAFVGTTERFDESLIALKRLLRWPYVFYLPALVNTSRPEREELSPSTVALIAERNEYDLELHDFANGLLDERVASAGESFADELDRFRADNRAFVDRHGVAAGTSGEATAR